MPHRCVRCGKIYDNAAPEILTGCSCGSHYFFFFREDDIKLRNQVENLTNKEREEILHDVKEIVGEEPETPVVLDLESIRIKKAGKFEIDLVNLFKRKPVVYKLEDGKYFIDIASTFQLMKYHDQDSLNDKIKDEIEKEEIPLDTEEKIEIDGKVLQKVDEKELEEKKEN